MGNTKFVTVALLLSCIGLAIGLGSYTFIYGKGYSYLKDDPKACVNCHIMRDQYESWERSSHRSVTTCNSCHAPENFYLKYFSKAENGFNHGWKFTTGSFNDPIRIRKHNFVIAMNACYRCHSELMDSTLHQRAAARSHSCVHCHKDVGHGH